MRDSVKRCVVACLIVLATASPAVLAQTTGPSGSDMFVDLVVARPLGLLGIVAGSAAFVIALPFTIPSGSVGPAAEELVKKPVHYTFQRPLGEIPDEGR
jgi:hypothetical protein